MLVAAIAPGPKAPKALQPLLRPVTDLLLRLGTVGTTFVRTRDDGTTEPVRFRARLFLSLADLPGTRMHSYHCILMPVSQAVPRPCICRRAATAAARAALSLAFTPQVASAWCIQERTVSCRMHTHGEPAAYPCPKAVASAPPRANWPLLKKLRTRRRLRAESRLALKVPLSKLLPQRSLLTDLPGYFVSLHWASTLCAIFLSIPCTLCTIWSRTVSVCAKGREEQWTARRWRLQRRGS